MAVPDVSRVLVATDDDRIGEVVRAFGGEVVMTDPACRNGTERCADALRGLGSEADIIVNLQGDAPLTPASVVPALVARLLSEPDAAMTTPAIRCSQSLYGHLVADQMAGRVGGTTVVFDARGRALYFSKRVIPYVPAVLDERNRPPVWQHVGVYAYRRAALTDYRALPPGEIELAEGLEQLRFLHAGLPVVVVPVPAPDWDMIELNNPEDLAPIEAALKARGIS